MSVNNLPKLVVAIVAQICATLLAIFGKVSGELAIGMISSVNLYILGNGIAARRGQPVEPIVGPKRRREL